MAQLEPARLSGVPQCIVSGVPSLQLDWSGFSSCPSPYHLLPLSAVKFIAKLENPPPHAEVPKVGKGPERSVLRSDSLVTVIPVSVRATSTLPFVTVPGPVTPDP